MEERYSSGCASGVSVRAILVAGTFGGTGRWPAVSNGPMRRPSPDTKIDLTVTIRWGEMVLVSRTLQDGQTVSVGEEDGSLAALPLGELGVSSLTVASLAGRTATAYVPSGAVAFVVGRGPVPLTVNGLAAVAMAPGESLSFSVGTFWITVSAAWGPAPDEDGPNVPRKSYTASILGFGAALLAHALVLGLSAEDARAASIEDAGAPVEEIAKYLAAADERLSSRDEVIRGGDGAGSTNQAGLHDGNGKREGGDRAKGSEGKMGVSSARPEQKGRYAIAQGSEDNPSASSSSRGDAIRDARDFGMVGVLAADAQRASFVSFGQITPSGQDGLAARGDLWGRDPAETAGALGLGLSGTGEGGGGSGLGIGLGGVSFGHGIDRGDGTGGLGMVRASWSGGGDYRQSYIPYRPRFRLKARLEIGRATVSPLVPQAGSVDPAPIERAVRAKREALLRCAPYALDELTETVVPSPKSFTMRFMIRENGLVWGASGSGEPSTAMNVSCLVRIFQRMTFPAREPGAYGVSVLVPMRFGP